MVTRLGPCLVEDCSNPRFTKGYCSKHYSRWKKYGDPLKIVKPRRDPVCTVEGCERPHESMGFCSLHYQRSQKGDLRELEPTKQRPWEERFDDNFHKTGSLPKWRPDLGPCWPWTRGNQDTGHAQLRADGRLQFVHRLAYERWVGPIPDGFQVDHLCRNGACVNPGHLEPVPGPENSRRARECPRCLYLTHCPSCGEGLPT